VDLFSSYGKGLICQYDDAHSCDVAHKNQAISSLLERIALHLSGHFRHNILWSWEMKTLDIVFSGEIEMSKPKSHVQHRDGRDGRFVTERQAERIGPDRATRERVPNPGYGDTGRKK
jgi:hypothetical protein